MKVLSLGAGVQSSALYALYINDYLPDPPEIAIFADTGAEPKSVYDWLKTLKDFGSHKIPIHIVSRGNLEQDLLKPKTRFSAVPWFMANGIGKRQCTNDYKIRPIRDHVKTLLGIKTGRELRDPVEMIIGISIDEIYRMKASPLKWIKNVYPLVMTLQWRRQNCEEYIQNIGLGKPPRSACVFCPYHSDQEWQRLKEDPDEWKRAVAVDIAIRHQPRFRKKQYAHRSLKPLEEVTFTDTAQIDMFNNQCEGMCGV